MTSWLLSALHRRESDLFDLMIMIGKLRPYEAYRHSGLEWFGSVPIRWSVRRIKTLFRESDDRCGERDARLLSLTRTRGLVPQSEASNRIASVDDVSNYKVCNPGDLVMNRMQAWSGMFAVSALSGVVSPDYSVFKCATTLNVEFFGYLFKTPMLVGQFARMSKGIGSGFNRLYTDDFGSIPIVVPDIADQNSIVGYLDHVDHQVRRYVRAKERLIGLLEEEKQAMINKAVTRGLDSSVRMKTSGVEWLGEMPEHWDVRRLKSLVTNVVVQTRERRADEVYLGLEHVDSWTGKYQSADADLEFDSQVKRFEPEDVLFGKLRPYLAKVVRAQHRGVCVGEFLVLRSISNEILPGYIELCLRSKSAIQAISRSTFGAKMPRADWTSIGSLKQPVPPIAEQEEIVQRIEAETCDIDAAVERHRWCIELADEYRTRLIADVVTGKLDVRQAADMLDKAPRESLDHD